MALKSCLAVFVLGFFAGCYLGRANCTTGCSVIWYYQKTMQLLLWTVRLADKLERVQVCISKVLENYWTLLGRCGEAAEMLLGCYLFSFYSVHLVWWIMCLCLHGFLVNVLVTKRALNPVVTFFVSATVPSADWHCFWYPTFCKQRLF